MTTFLVLLFLLSFLPNAVAALETEAAAIAGRIHPRIFELVTSWDSDTEEPVVTEINLDAISKNRNQFDFSKVKKTGVWIECPGDDGLGFSRFRIIKTEKNRFQVEFQRNAGGTLTTATLIEFVAETRDVLKAGQTHSIRVLRVTSIESISDQIDGRTK